MESHVRQHVLVHYPLVETVHEVCCYYVGKAADQVDGVLDVVGEGKLLVNTAAEFIEAELKSVQLCFFCNGKTIILLSRHVPGGHLSC